MCRSCEVENGGVTTSCLHFDPLALFEKMRGAEYEWEDLNRLVRQGEKLVPEEIIKIVENRFSPLKKLTDLERKVVADSKAWKTPTHAQKLRGEVIKRAGKAKSV